MATTRSKARGLEQATSNSGPNRQNTEGTQNTLSDEDPVDAVVCREAPRGAVDNNAPTHGKDTESNGALVATKPTGNELPSTILHSAATSKARCTTSDNNHAQAPSVAPATIEIDVPKQQATVSDEPEVLSDASNKTDSKFKTSAANDGLKPCARRGRGVARPRGKRSLSVADERAKHSEVVPNIECAAAENTSVDIRRPPGVETSSSKLPSATHNSDETLTTPPSRALPINKGKSKTAGLTESSKGCSQGTGNEKSDTADALLQLWTSRPSAQCLTVRSTSRDEPTPAAESSAQPRRCHRLEVKKEAKEKERQEKERQEKESQKKERQEKERREKEKWEKERWEKERQEKAKKSRIIGDKASNATTKKGKAAGINTPGAAANATKRKREVADLDEVEDAVQDGNPKRKGPTSRPPEQGTEHPIHDRCSPSTYSVLTCGSTDAFQSSDASEVLNASETINTSGTTNASRIMENFEHFDVKQRIRDYMQVSALRSTLQESGYEDPLDEDDVPSPAPAFRRIIPTLSGFRHIPPPYYLNRLVPMQPGHIWRPTMRRW